MSTYTDLNNRIKETLNVDYHTRVTPQKAHFLHPENTYWGKLKGEIEVKGNNEITGGSITSVLLQDSVLNNVSFKNGLKLDNIEQEFTAISSELIRQYEVDEKLSADINTETFWRTKYDTIISSSLFEKIEQTDIQANIRDIELSNAISVEHEQRISADNLLLEKIEDIPNKHLQLYTIDNREFPLQIKDFAVNTYIDSNANAYVYKNGNVGSLPIGRIEKARYNNNNILTSFEFNAFADNVDTYEITANGRFQYYFDKDNTVQYTGVGGYRLTLDLATFTSLQDMQLRLDSANNKGYYNVYHNDLITPAGKINADYTPTAEGKIGACLFQVTNQQQLSNFILPAPFKFTSNGETLVFTGRNGKTCEATLSDNNIYLYEDHTKKYYLPVKENQYSTEVAKIYNGNVKFAEDGSLNEIIVDYNTGKQYLLYKQNDFKANFDESRPSCVIQYHEVSNIITVKDEIKYYKYMFDNNQGSLVPGQNVDPNKRIDDEYEVLGITLNTGIQQINKNYVLTQQGTSPTYRVEEDIENFGRVELEFTKLENTAKVTVYYLGSSDTTVLNFVIQDSASPTIIDQSVTRMQSLKLCDSIYNIRFNEMIIDDQYAQKYVLVVDLSKLEFSGESKVRLYRADLEKKDSIDLLMPEKDDETATYDPSIKFVLNFKIYTESLQDTDLVTLNIISRNDIDKFYYMNKQVNKIMIVKNRWSTLEFNEIRPHRYIINDLDYSEISWKLDQLKDHLSAAEMNIDVVSSKVDFLLSTDREGIAFKGTMLSASELDACELSGYMYNTLKDQEYFLKQGFMYQVSANHFFKTNHGTGEITGFFGAGDCFIFNKNTILKNTEFADINIIRNSEAEFGALSTWTSCNFFNRYTNNYLSGKNTFDGTTSANNLIADIASVKTEDINNLTAINTVATNAYIYNLSSASLENIKLIDRFVRSDPYNPELVTYISTLQDVLDLSTTTIEKEIHELSASLSNTTKLSVEELQKQIVANDDDIEFLSDEIDRLSTEVSTLVDLSVKNLQSQIVSNDNDISEISNKVEFILSIDRETVNYKGILPYYYNPSLVPTAQYLSDFIKPLVDESIGGMLKLGDLFKLSATQSALYDSEGNVNYYGKNDFFILNKDTVLTAIKNSDIDIFRNSQSEVEWLSNALCSEINSLSASLSNTTKLSVEELQKQIVANDHDISVISSYISDIELSVNGISVEVNRISTELNNELNKAKLSVNGISVEVNRISTELSAELNRTQLSVNGISVEVNRISTELSVELNRTQLSVNGISVEVNRISAELSTDLSVVKYHYNKTFTEKEYAETATGRDIKVDILNIVDSTNTNNKYYLELEDGTLVLKFIDT